MLQLVLFHLFEAHHDLEQHFPRCLVDVQRKSNVATDLMSDAVSKNV